MSIKKFRLQQINDRIGNTQYPGAKSAMIMAKTTSSRMLDIRRGFQEPAPKAGLRPLRNVGDWFGNVIAKGSVKMPKVSNRTLLQTSNTLSETAPVPKTIGVGMINQINSGKLPDYVTNNSGAKKMEIDLLKQMKNNYAKLIAIELIKGTIQGMKYKELIPGGGANKNALASTAYNQLLSRYAVLVNDGGQIDEDQAKIYIDQFENALEGIYGKKVYDDAPADRLQKGIEELASLSGSMSRLVSQDNAAGSTAPATPADIQALSGGLERKRDITADDFDDMQRIASMDENEAKSVFGDANLPEVKVIRNGFIQVLNQRKIGRPLNPTTISQVIKALDRLAEFSRQQPPPPGTSPQQPPPPSPGTSPQQPQPPQQPQQPQQPKGIIPRDLKNEIDFIINMDSQTQAREFAPESQDFVDNQRQQLQLIVNKRNITARDIQTASKIVDELHAMGQAFQAGQSPERKSPPPSPSGPKNRPPYIPPPRGATDDPQTRDYYPDYDKNPDRLQASLDRIDGVSTKKNPRIKQYRILLQNATIVKVPAASKRKGFDRKFFRDRIVSIIGDLRKYGNLPKRSGSGRSKKKKLKRAVRFILSN